MKSHVGIPVKGEIWYWALKESHRDIEEIAHRFPAIEKWISGEKNPTFRQIEMIAKYLGVPFGYLFLKEPPKKNIMEAEFRSIDNKLPRMSKNLRDTIMDMDNKRHWMSDYRKTLGWEKLDVIVQFNENKCGDILADALLAKNLLGLGNNWYEAVVNFDNAYGFLREKLEDAGILIMQNGIVGMNTRRKLDINEFRAFMLYDDIAPLIFINNNDTKAGKVFSLIHEYIHILFEQEDLFLNINTEGGMGREGYINNLTAEFLMPAEHVGHIWNRQQENVKQICELSDVFKVSRIALAIKLKSMGLIDSKTVAEIKHKSIYEFTNRTGTPGGGDFYKTYHTRMSPVFTEAVIRSAESGEIGYTHAFKLLGGIKGSTYDKIKETMMPYE